jgi:hypothetical protein
VDEASDGSKGKMDCPNEDKDGRCGGPTRRPFSWTYLPSAVAKQMRNNSIQSTGQPQNEQVDLPTFGRTRYSPLSVSTQKKLERSWNENHNKSKTRAMCFADLLRRAAPNCDHSAGATDRSSLFSSCTA